jgi:hypothetical protein
VIHAGHRHVPVGTIADHEGTPVTVFRDYSHAHILALELDIAGVDQLAAILPGLRAQMVAAKAEEAEDEAERLAHEAWRDGEDDGEPAEDDANDDPFGPNRDPDESARQWKASGRTQAMAIVREYGDNDDDSGRDRQRFGRSAF